MGLDVAYYSKVTFVRPFECSEDVRTAVQLEALYTFLPNAGQTDGLQDGWYEVEGEGGFRAGSYGGYNAWRAWLAGMFDMAPRLVWREPDRFKGRPFVELINFSDCEGFIGPKTSAKLAKDFREHLEIVKGESDLRAATLYERFMGAFETAARGGVVKFC